MHAGALKTELKKVLKNLLQQNKNETKKIKYLKLNGIPLSYLKYRMDFFSHSLPQEVIIMYGVVLPPLSPSMKCIINHGVFIHSLIMLYIFFNHERRVNSFSSLPRNFMGDMEISNIILYILQFQESCCFHFASNLDTYILGHAY